MTDPPLALVKALLLSAERASLAEAEGRLVRWGFEVAWFDDAETAWRSCRSDPPGLYLLEWPKDDLAGLEFCRRIRSAANGHLRFVWILTDRTGPAVAKALMDYGADDCLRLPLDGETLDVRLAAVKRRLIEIQDRDQIQEALRRSNERFDLAVSGANEGLWDALVLPGVPWHSPETPVWYSPRLKEMLGFRDDEFPNVLGSWLVRLHPDDRDRILQAVADHVERRVTYDVEYRLRTKSGDYRWFSARGLGIWNAAGEMTRMAGSMRDITETRRTADALKSSEEKWRGLVEHAPDYILVVDLEGTIRFINRVGPDYKIEEVIGANALDFGPMEDRQRVKEAIDSVARTGQPARLETSVIHPDGRVGWYASRLGPIVRDGRVESVIIITSDISDRKQSEAALRREQEFLRRLLDLQERDRQLVAYEIHDGMVQEMTGALMHLEAFKHADDQRLREQEFERGSRLLREAVNEARRLISGLRPPVIDDLGVVAAVEYLINEARADLPNIEYVHRTTFDRLVPPLERRAIFRIVQEALSNVRKHSGTRRARVELIETGNTLRLSIRDWGCGFDPDTVSREPFGLQGIRQRARLLGTTAIIESAPGKGALIAVDLPLIHAEQDAPASEMRSAANGDADEPEQASEVVRAGDAEI